MSWFFLVPLIIVLTAFTALFIAGFVFASAYLFFGVRPSRIVADVYALRHFGD